MLSTSMPSHSWNDQFLPIPTYRRSREPEDAAAAPWRTACCLVRWGGDPSCRIMAGARVRRIGRCRHDAQDSGSVRHRQVPSRLQAPWSAVKRLVAEVRAVHAREGLDHRAAGEGDSRLGAGRRCPFPLACMPPGPAREYPRSRMTHPRGAHRPEMSTALRASGCPGSPAGRRRRAGAGPRGDGKDCGGRLHLCGPGRGMCATTSPARHRIPAPAKTRRQAENLHAPVSVMRSRGSPSPGRSNRTRRYRPGERAGQYDPPPHRLGNPHDHRGNPHADVPHLPAAIGRAASADPAGGPVR
jgi:hypothetical protein